MGGAACLILHATDAAQTVLAIVAVPVDTFVVVAYESEFPKLLNNLAIKLLLGVSARDSAKQFLEPAVIVR